LAAVVPASDPNRGGTQQFKEISPQPTLAQLMRNKKLINNAVA